MKRILLAICLSLMCLSWNGNAEATNWVACPNNATMFWDADSVHSKPSGEIVFNTKGIDSAHNVTFIFDMFINAQRGMVTYTYGRVYDSNGNLVHEGAMARPMYIDTLKEAKMYREIIAYCDRNNL